VEADYWFKVQAYGRGHWARVHVRVEIASRSQAAVASDAGPWHKRHSGKLSWESRLSDELRDGAVRGAVYALDEAGVTAVVTVMGIQESPVDTSAQDVAACTARAVWTALEHTPARPPVVDEHVIHFPSG
jgi:hypothetical protein